MRENEHDALPEDLRDGLLQAVHEGVAKAEDVELNAPDRGVIADERAFIARFWRDLPHRDRVNPIRLTHQADLTDREIHLLLITGSLRFDAHGAHLAASRSLAIYGHIIMGFLGLELLEAWDLATHSSLPVPNLVPRFVGVMVILLLGTWVVRQIYQRPRQIQRRVDARRKDATCDGVMSHGQ